LKELCGPQPTKLEAREMFQPRGTINAPHVYQRAFAVAKKSGE